ncbi:hypothetical protein HII31_07393 [Pseudocercospora fuligena]|uniref:mRNA export factor GLE1 n=1 Tax=Pseudocercospora fuligena TaxID=685502 RepID=A0A8H6RGD8_9PEZI|nr:hypothetical protein HII31_07393 [Pseudocercospora fuligena]
MSSPGARSSPSRRRVNGYHRHSQNEAQSAQLIEELSQLLLDDDRSFRRRLDEEAQAQQKRHVEALERALAHHDAIRRSAEHTYEAIQLQQERERLAREAEERRRVEEQRRRLEQEREAQRRREEEQRRRAEEEERQRREQAERERQAAAEREAARKQQEEAARAREQQAAQEKAARDKEESEKKAREDAAAAQAQQQRQSQVASQAPGSHSGNPLDVSIGPAAVSTLSNAAPKALVSTIDDRMRVHEAYLRIHRRLKVLRQEVDGLKNSNAPDQQRMYAQLREKKATITKTMGQLLKGESEQNKKNNIDKIQVIKETWQWAQSFFPNETIDINEVRVEPVPPVPVTKGLVYIINHTTKAIIKQMSIDAVADPKYADVIGVVTAQIFSGTTQLSGGHAMSDTFLAKFNKVHPVLFGKVGSEKGAEALKGLGWDTSQFNKDQAFPRFVGMSRCFAAITLRDFSRAKTQVNPFPNRLFWEAVARILNTPSQDQMVLQYVTLQGLLDPEYIGKFIRHYGNMALAVLRVAVKDFPERRPQDNNTIRQQAQVLSSFCDRYELECNLHL